MANLARVYAPVYLNTYTEVFYRALVPYFETDGKDHLLLDSVGAALTLKNGLNVHTAIPQIEQGRQYGNTDWAVDVITASKKAIHDRDAGAIPDIAVAAKEVESEIVDWNGDAEGVLNNDMKVELTVPSIYETAEERAIRQEWVDNAKSLPAEVVIANLRSATALLSPAARWIDPKLGQSLAAAMTSTIDVGVGVYRFCKTLARFAVPGAALTVTGALDLASQVATIVQGLQSLFTGSPMIDPVQAGIKELQRQVGQLRTEMHDRFDRIDRQLGSIYDVLVRGLNRLDSELGVIHGSITALANDMASVSERLDRFQSNFYEISADSARQTFWTETDAALGWPERSTHPLPESLFVRADSFLTTWGTRTAFASFAAGPAGRSLSPDDLQRELAAFPLESNINFISSYLDARWGLGFLTRRAPNPLDWQRAALARAKLMTQWPARAARTKPSEDGTLRQVGDSLAEDLSRISERDGHPNRALFDRAFGEYADDANALSDAIADLELDWKGRHRGIDPHGPGRQFPSDYPFPVETTRCDSPGVQALPITSQLYEPMFPAPTLTAWALETHSVALCYEARFQPDPPTGDPPAPKPPCTTINCPVYASTVVTLRLRLDAELGRPTDYCTASITGPKQEVGLKGAPGQPPFLPSGDAYAIAKRDWNSLYPALIEAIQSAGGSCDRVLVSSLQRENERALDTANPAQITTHDLYREISAAMTGPASGAAAAVHGAAVRLDGARDLISSLIKLGFPRAAQQDEFLHGIVFGAQSLPGSELFGCIYQQTTTGPPLSCLTAQGLRRPSNPEPGFGQLRENPRGVAGSQLQSRVAAAAKQIKGYLDLIGSGHWKETDPGVEATLARLQMGAYLRRGAIRPKLTGVDVHRSHLGSDGIADVSFSIDHAGALSVWVARRRTGTTQLSRVAGVLDRAATRGKHRLSLHVFAAKPTHGAYVLFLQPITATGASGAVVRRNITV